MTSLTRLKKLRLQLKPHQAYLISNPKDIYYFTHFFSLVPEEREAFLVVTADQAWLLYNSFSPYQPPTGITPQPGCSLNNLQTAFNQLKKEAQLKSVLIDKTSLFVNEYEALQEIKLKLQTLDRQQIWSLRTIKDKQEIESLRKAGQVTQQVMTIIWNQLEPGQTEETVRNLIEAELKRAGSQRPAFPTIVAFGTNTALPHHQPTAAVLEKEMAVLMDFGATIDGYCGDMTRSGWFGQSSPDEYQTLEKIVKQAYRAGLERCQTANSGKLKARDLDQATREIITQAGFGHYFIHTTGHGLGLDIHESLSLHQANQQLIKPGMILTIEPGIYLQNKFGYRYENMVLVTKNGAEELTS